MQRGTKFPADAVQFLLPRVRGSCINLWGFVWNIRQNGNTVTEQQGIKLSSWRFKHARFPSNTTTSTESEKIERGTNGQFVSRFSLRVHRPGLKLSCSRVSRDGFMQRLNNFEFYRYTRWHIMVYKPVYEDAYVSFETNFGVETRRCLWPSRSFLCLSVFTLAEATSRYCLIECRRALRVIK